MKAVSSEETNSPSPEPFILRKRGMCLLPHGALPNVGEDNLRESEHDVSKDETKSDER